MRTENHKRETRSNLNYFPRNKLKEVASFHVESLFHSPPRKQRAVSRRPCVASHGGEANSRHIFSAFNGDSQPQQAGRVGEEREGHQVFYFFFKLVFFLPSATPSLAHFLSEQYHPCVGRPPYFGARNRHTRQLASCIGRERKVFKKVKIKIKIAAAN